MIHNHNVHHFLSYLHDCDHNHTWGSARSPDLFEPAMMPGKFINMMIDAEHDNHDNDIVKLAGHILACTFK